MMALELGCNASILLALSVAWPEPVRVVWPFTLDCGFRFVYNWEPESSFESRKGVELLYERIDNNLVLIAEEKVRLLFHPFNISEEYWSRQWVSWPALFARFGIEMK